MKKEKLILVLGKEVKGRAYLPKKRSKSARIYELEQQVEYLRQAMEDFAMDPGTPGDDGYSNSEHIAKLQNMMGNARNRIFDLEVDSADISWTIALTIWLTLLTIAAIAFIL